MTAHPDALRVLAEALHTVGDEIGFNADDDAQFVARRLEAEGFDIVPRRRTRRTAPPETHPTNTNPEETRP